MKVCRLSAAQEVQLGQEAGQAFAFLCGLAGEGMDRTRREQLWAVANNAALLRFSLKEGHIRCLTARWSCCTGWSWDRSPDWHSSISSDLRREHDAGRKDAGKSECVFAQQLFCAAFKEDDRTER